MGDLSVNAARAILERHGQSCTTFVETGTHDGMTLWPMCDAGIFTEIHSVELSRLYHTRAVARASLKLTRVEPTLHFGDSALVLPTLCPLIEEPTMFWLDAHYFDGTDATGSPCPLFAELDAIAARRHADVVVIDDVQCFGTKWSDGPGGDWTHITRDSILNRFNGRVRESYVWERYQFVVHLRGALP